MILICGFSTHEREREGESFDRTPTIKRNERETIYNFEKKHNMESGPKQNNYLFRFSHKGHIYHKIYNLPIINMPKLKL